MKDIQLPSSMTEEELINNNKTYLNNPRNSGRWISAFSFKPNRSCIQHGNVNLHDLLYPSPPKESSIDVVVAKSCDGPLEEDYGRERIKKHRKEVAAGKVKIPEKWDHEELLRDWMDHYSFDASLAPKGVSSAREALAAEGRRARSTCCPGIEDRSREQVLSI